MGKIHEGTSQQGCHTGGCSLSFMRPPQGGQEKERCQKVGQERQRPHDPIWEHELWSRGQVWDKFHGLVFFDKVACDRPCMKFPATAQDPSCCLWGPKGAWCPGQGGFGFLELTSSLKLTSCASEAPRVGPFTACCSWRCANKSYQLCLQRTKTFNTSKKNSQKHEKGAVKQCTQCYYATSPPAVLP